MIQPGKIILLPGEDIQPGFVEVTRSLLSFTGMQVDRNVGIEMTCRNGNLSQIPFFIIKK